MLLQPLPIRFVFPSPAVFSLWLLLCLVHLFTALLRISPAPSNLPDSATALSANSLTILSYTHQLNNSALFQLYILTSFNTSLSLEVGFHLSVTSPPSQCHLLASYSPSTTQPHLPLSLHLVRAELEEHEVSPNTAEESKICSHISNISVIHRMLNASAESGPEPDDLSCCLHHLCNQRRLLHQDP